MNIPKMSPDMITLEEKVKTSRLHDASIVFKTYLYTALTVFVAMGFLYATNFVVTVTPRVTTVSPIAK